MYNEQLAINFGKEPAVNKQQNNKAENVTKKEGRREEKLSSKTKELLEKRMKLIPSDKRNSTEYSEINKLARKSADIIEYETRLIEDMIKKSIKSL